MRVTCQSGIKGWQLKLRSIYKSKTEFMSYSEMYGLHTRLGFETADEAWSTNPTVQGSVIPSDYMRIK